MGPFLPSTGALTPRRLEPHESGLLLDYGDEESAGSQEPEAGTSEAPPAIEQKPAIDQRPAIEQKPAIEQRPAPDQRPVQTAAEGEGAARLVPRGHSMARDHRS